VQAAVQPELGVIRQAANRAGTMLRRWQQTDRKPDVSLQYLDLNQVVRELPLPDELRNPAGETVSVRFQPAPGLASVLANVPDVQRLVHLLLTAAAEVSPRGASITVRIEPAQGQVLLSVEDQGPEVNTDLLERVFEPFAGVRGGLFPGSAEEELRLATCKVLARRQKGTITAANRVGGGLIISVGFAAAASK
jgi:signal transduction histidine kinase